MSSNLIDTTALEALLTKLETQENEFRTILHIEKNDNIIKYIQKIDDTKLEIGVEFCKLTADRNSPTVARFIKPEIAKSLIDSIKSGRYK